MTDERTLIKELIKKHADLFGVQIAVSLARKVNGIKIASNGDVLELTGSHQIVLADLVDMYTSFAGEISHTILKRIIEINPGGHA